MKNLLLLLGLVFGSVGLLYVGGAFASSQTEVSPPPATAPAAAPVEPAVITIEVPAAATKFVVGDNVTVDGLTLLDGTVPTGKVVEVQEVTQWINLQTGEAVDSRAYVIEFTVNGQTEQVRVPELAIKKAQ